jgi:osmotically-inducible protein OsmY
MNRHWSCLLVFLAAGAFTPPICGQARLRPNLAASPAVEPQPTRTALPPPPAKDLALPAPAAFSAKALHAAEIAVELAWLGDALTFPYPLRAKANQGRIDLLGHVPSETIRDKAMALALGATTAPVCDRLTVLPNMAFSFSVSPESDFAAQARARVLALGDLEVKRIELRATKEGKLCIGGLVESPEEKLAYSRVFRGLPGCKAVRNEMVVAPPVIAAGFDEDNNQGHARATEAEPNSRASSTSAGSPSGTAAKLEFRPAKRELPTLGPPRKASRGTPVRVDFN